jgi:hypothetical protein
MGSEIFEEQLDALRAEVAALTPLVEAMERMLAWTESMQMDCGLYLVPDSQYDQAWLVDRMIFELDGPNQREAQGAARAALAAYRNLTQPTQPQRRSEMKKLVNVQEVEGEGLISLMGEKVILFCMNYFYAGTLVGVNDDVVLLEDGGIVFETGPYTDSKWKDFQKIGSPLYVSISSIEAFTKGK